MLPAITRREWGWVIRTAALIVALASLPYLAGWMLAPAGYRFTGLLVNPIDGHSYLAKMGQGAAGSWLFHLPYTSERHEGVFMFTYHLALGHLVPGGAPVALVWVYHLARVVFGSALLAAVYGAAATLSSSVSYRRSALLLVGLASGLGWLVGTSPDLTVPEAVTFPSLMVNAHFGLTALLMLLLVFGMTLAPLYRGWWAAIAVGSACLTMIQPFAPLVVGVAAGSWLVVGYLWERRLPWPHIGRLVVFAGSSVPLLIYFWWVARTNPQIGRWMEQNVTPSPPAWQWLVGYGLLLPLAAAGAWRVVQRRGRAGWLPLVWAAGQIALMMLPMPLQRRLSTGLHLPICLLAATGLEAVASRLRARSRPWLKAGLLSIMFISNLLIMLAGASAVLNRNPYVLLTDDQWAAMEWLRENVAAESVVLADVELATAVPAWGGGARVVYGHPFETLDTEARRRAVEDYYSGRMATAEQIAFPGRFGVGVILVQSDRLSTPALPPEFEQAWRSGPLVIYRAEPS